MSATKAVPETCELLEIITSFLPPRHIARLIRVNRTWQVIAQSDHMLRFRILAPALRRDATIASEGVLRDYPIMGSVYDVCTKVEFNTAFAYYWREKPIKHIICSHTITSTSLWFSRASTISREVREQSHEWATFRPVQVLSTIWLDANDEVWDCCIYNRRGIRIADVLEATRSAQAIDLPPDDDGWVGVLLRKAGPGLLNKIRACKSRRS